MPSRRDFALSLAAASLLAAVPALAQAPTALNLFIPAAPGGGWDGTGRTIEMAMRTDGVIKEFKFENVGGAGGAVGLPRFLARKGQGDTVMVAGMVMVGALIAANSPVKMADATPLARLTDEYEVVVVPAGSPHKTMADLIASFKADPGKVSWAGGSAGGSDHILAGMIGKAVGVDPKRVTYIAYAGGGPALAALLGSQVTAGISGYSEFAEQIRADSLEHLSVSFLVTELNIHRGGTGANISYAAGLLGARPFGSAAVEHVEAAGRHDLAVRLGIVVAALAQPLEVEVVPVHVVVEEDRLHLPLPHAGRLL